MKLPLKIENCPIIDAIVEIRFETNLPPDAVFGVVYNQFKSKYTKVDDLPLSKAHDIIIQKNPSLKYGAHHKISNGNFVLQVGPNMFAISNVPKYVGWKTYSAEIYDCLSKIDKLGIINKVIRIGIRYINFFELDILNSIRLKINFDGDLFKSNNTVLRTEIIEDEFIKTLQIANNAIYTINNKKDIKGSFIDLDIVLEKEITDFFGNMNKIIEKGHEIEKRQFFSLLEDEFLKSLKPIYE